MKFAIRYEEVFADTYYVEAKTSEEAISKLYDAISTGDIIPPDQGVGWSAFDLRLPEEDIPETEV